MTLMSRLLGDIYEITRRQLVGNQLAKYAFFESIFTTYCDRYDCTASTVSKYFTGKRILKYKFLRLYTASSSEIPLCPTLLYRDIDKICVAILTRESTRVKLMDVLDAFLASIPAADAARILHVQGGLAQDNTKIVIILLTRIIWYAACQDAYDCKGGQ